MDNPSEIFNLILKSNTFNFVIFLLIIIIIAKLVDVEKILSNMKNKVIDSIETSNNTKLEALKSLDDANIEYAKIPNKLQEITTNADNKLKSLAQGVKNDTEEKIHSMRINAQNIVEAESKQLKTNLISKLGIKAVETAQEYIVAELKYNPKLHEKFINEAINELDEVVL